MLPIIMVCAALTVVDGDTVKCDGQKLRLLGEGIVDVRGIDTPELRTWKCEKERRLARLARARLKQLLAGEEIRIVAEGFDKTPDKRPLVTGLGAASTPLRVPLARIPFVNPPLRQPGKAHPASPEGCRRAPCRHSGSIEKGPSHG